MPVVQSSLILTLRTLTIAFRYSNRKPDGLKLSNVFFEAPITLSLGSKLIRVCMVFARDISVLWALSLWCFRFFAFTEEEILLYNLH